MGKAKITFKKWLKELQMLFTEYGKKDPDQSKEAKKFWRNYVKDCGEDCWRESYDDGDDPFYSFDAEIDAMRDG